MKNSPPAIKLLVIVWLTLVALHFSILGISFLKLGSRATPVIVALALIQMLLIMLYFMELRHGHKIVRVCAAAGFFWLLIQWTLTLSDYLMRQWH